MPSSRSSPLHVPPGSVRLRPVVPADLPAMFEMQSDPASNEMAGTKPRTREVFFAVWEQHFANPRINARVIELDGGGGAGGNGGVEVAGSIACFQAGHPIELDCVGYWIARAHWGRGIASRALGLFLAEELRRPLHATAASTNVPSRRILERHGFAFTGLAMGEETDRFIAREIANYVLS